MKKVSQFLAKVEVSKNVRQGTLLFAEDLLILPGVLTKFPGSIL